jgi:hypothetical protein
MKSAKEWAESAPHVWDTDLHYEYVAELVRDVRLEAINAAADIVRDTGQPGCCELATRIVETLTRG